MKRIHRIKIFCFFNVQRAHTRYLIKIYNNVSGLNSIVALFVAHN